MGFQLFLGLQSCANVDIAVSRLTGLLTSRIVGTECPTFFPP